LIDRYILAELMIRLLRIMMDRVEYAVRWGN